MSNDPIQGTSGPISPAKATPPISDEDVMKGGAQGSSPDTAFNLAGNKSGGAAVAEPTPMDVSGHASGKISPNLTQATQESVDAHAKAIAQELTKLQQEAFPKIQAQAEISTGKPAALSQISFKQAYANQISNSLSRITDNFSVINSKLGSTPPNLETPTKASKNLENFLNYIAGSQGQLKNLTASLQNNPKITPGDLLAVQVKMTGIQQQVEFFTTILGKAVDNIKTILNIQN